CGFQNGSRTELASHLQISSVNPVRSKARRGRLGFQPDGLRFQRPHQSGRVYELMSAELSPNQLPLAPLGAGDLIDRAVRLYRRHLFVLIRTAAPPVIIAAAGWIVLGIAFRRVVNTSNTDEVVIYLLVAAVSTCVVVGGYLFTLVVMGGATRTLVAHLLNNE